MAYSLMTVAHALALARRTEEADKAIVECKALPLGDKDEYIADALPARAWAEVSRGDFPRAGDLLRQAARVARRQGSLARESAALHDLARLGRPAEVIPRLLELATVIEGELIQARTAHTVALVQGNAPALEAASDIFETTEPTCLLRKRPPTRRWPGAPSKSGRHPQAVLCTAAIYDTCTRIAGSLNSATAALADTRLRA